MSAPLLEVKGVTLKYRDALKPAVENLSFTMERREILSLRGPSGAGKSTVVWALMGMMQDYGIEGRGEITFSGKKISLEEEPRGLHRSWHEIALVPQSSMSALNPVRTIGQTIIEMMVSHEPGKRKKDCMPRIRQLLEIVHLDREILKAYPHELSGGMKQRVSIALAILYEPQLLILDEATTGLDLLVEADILGTIRRIQAQSDMSILMITHDRRLSDAFCHRRIEIGGSYDGISER